MNFDRGDLRDLRRGSGIFFKNSKENMRHVSAKFSLNISKEEVCSVLGQIQNIVLVIDYTANPNPVRLTGNSL